MRDKEARERLWNLYFRLDELKATIRGIREGERGADWMHRTSRPLVDGGKQVPAVIVRYITNMMKTGTTVLVKEREATAQECEMEESRTGRSVKSPLIITEKIADITGLQVLDPANNLRQILIIDLEVSGKLGEAQPHFLKT